MNTPFLSLTFSFPVWQKIDPSNLVLKVDTEGAEKNILLQLRPWIAQYKPSMLLSFVSRIACPRRLG